MVELGPATSATASANGMAAAVGAA
jgi:hypothetical protein